MPPIPTPRTALDHKLHYIILASDSSIRTMIGLAEKIADKKSDEFSYVRDEETQFVGATGIVPYVSYANTVGLLNEDLLSTRPKAEIKSLEHFQVWLSELVFEFLNSNGIGIPLIKSKIPDLFQQPPYKLPTLENVMPLVDSALQPKVLRLSLRIMALLRPNIIQFKSQTMILIPGTVE